MNAFKWNKAKKSDGKEGQNDNFIGLLSFYPNDLSFRMSLRVS